MREQVVRFGNGDCLVGILTEPGSGLRSTTKPNVLLWNVGIHHRVGPNRIFVDLARELAGRGFVCLRFDISGLGDSEASRSDAESDKVRACEDIRAAIQLVSEKTKNPHALLIAFCSGVDAAHAIATTDARVVGYVSIEGYRYKTPGYYGRFPKRYADVSRWERLLRLRFPRLLPPEMRVLATSTKGQVFIRELVTLDQFRLDVRSMLARGTKLLFVFAGRDATYAYRTQLHDALADANLSKGLDIRYYPDADHMFFIQAHRERVIQDISQWAAEHFESSSSSTP